MGQNRRQVGETGKPFAARRQQAEIDGDDGGKSEPDGEGGVFERRPAGETGGSEGIDHPTGCSDHDQPVGGVILRPDQPTQDRFIPHAIS